MAHPLLADTPGKKWLLLGNEAIVRGALEGGVRFVSCYPGTPSSEVPDTFYRLSTEGDFRFEYSVNEKVALEVGGGAAIGGLPTLVTMKHVGVNVAADPLMTLAYVGVPGGLVLLSADDPGCHSSQNEQDNRYYARLAGMVCLEPASAQEAKDMTRDAIDLSRKWERPVLLRTTTRVNHLRGPVEFGTKDEKPAQGSFEKNPGRFVPVPANARTARVRLLDFLAEAMKVSESSPWNKVSGQGDVAVIATGISRAYASDAMDELGIRDRVRFMELGMSYPLPEKSILSLMESVRTVLVLEELEPVMETEIRALAQKHGVNVAIMGKDVLPQAGEYTVSMVGEAIQQALGEPGSMVRACAPSVENLPPRPPNLCAGCSHRALYYAVRQVYGDDAVYSSDIGCYTLGILPPLSCADFLLCMGSSISAGSGMAKAQPKPVVAFIGDSTFFHSGITGIVNAVYNKHDLLVVIMDNRTTAMTGHQPHPGVDVSVLGDNESKVDIETVVRGCGVDQIERVSPFKLQKTLGILEEMKKKSGVRVLIAEEPCVLFARRTLRKRQATVSSVVNQSQAVKDCLERFACPAFYRDGDDVLVDPEQCAGCMVCIQITRDFKAVKRS